MPFAARPANQREEAYKLRLKGLTIRQIAAVLSVPEATIYSWADRLGWAARVKDSKPVEKEPEPELSFPQQQQEYKVTMAEQALRIAKAIKATPDDALVARAEKIDKLDKVARKALDLEQPQAPVIVNLALLSGSPPASAYNLPARPVNAAIEKP